MLLESKVRVASRFRATLQALLLAALLLFSLRAGASEYANTYVYNGVTDVNYVWWVDATTNVQGASSI
jgi:hypothetical protein